MTAQRIRAATTSRPQFFSSSQEKAPDMERTIMQGRAIFISREVSCLSKSPETMWARQANRPTATMRISWTDRDAAVMGITP